jgi:hypothetical protein
MTKMRKLLIAFATTVVLVGPAAARAGEFHFVCESQTDTSKHVELRGRRAAQPGRMLECPQGRALRVTLGGSTDVNRSW